MISRRGLICCVLPALLLCISAGPQSPAAQHAAITYDAAVKQAMGKFDTTVDQATTRAEDQIASARTTYIQSLKAARITADRENDQAEITAIQTEIDRVSQEPPMPGTDHKISAADVVGKKFILMTAIFKKNPLTLSKDGRVGNAWNPNESYWRIEDGHLELISADQKTITSVYDFYKAKDGAITLAGEFRMPDRKLANGKFEPVGLFPYE